MKKLYAITILSAFIMSASTAMAATYYANPGMEKSQQLINKQEDFIKKMDDKTTQTNIKIQDAQADAKAKEEALKKQQADAKAKADADAKARQDALKKQQDANKQNLDSIKKDINTLKQPYQK